MPKPSLLYLCINDGSDTRINKEVRTLAERFGVHYVGIGRSCDRSFVKPYCTEFTLIQGHHKDKVAFLRYWQKASRLLLTRRYDAIHVINEQLVLLFYPFLYRQRHRVVLDIFDSIFLRARREMEWLKNVTYRLPARLLGTDRGGASTEFGADEASYWEAMRLLATVRADGGRPLGEAVLAERDRLGESVVLVSRTRDEELPASVRKLREIGLSVIVVALATHTYRTPPGSGGAAQSREAEFLRSIARLEAAGTAVRVVSHPAGVGGLSERGNRELGAVR